MRSELDAFLDSWTVDQNGVKPVFTSMYEYLRACDGVSLTYKGRPGVSHSLRARHAAQNTRELFVLVDIIDDEPDARWLSVCFYADLVTDPEERGDVVPGGLMGEDACCFDVDVLDDTTMRYMLQRLQEATTAAGQAKG
jgi:hypothetical protein